MPIPPGNNTFDTRHFLFDVSWKTIEEAIEFQVDFLIKIALCKIEMADHVTEHAVNVLISIKTFSETNSN